MNKVRAAKMLLSLGGVQGVVVPSVGTGDSGIITITLEGSSSMYDPVQIMSEVLKADGQTLEVNILPLGSSMGKESYKQQQVNFILTSIDERKDTNTNPYSLESEITETKENGNRQVYFGQDPLVFIFKKDPKCTSELKYEPYDLDNYLEKGDSGKGEKDKWKGNRKDLIDLFKNGSGSFSSCSYSSFIREGGKLRSNLNKAFLATPEKGFSDGFIQKCDLKSNKTKTNCESLKTQDSLTICQDNYLCWPNNNNNSDISGEALPENNWLAVERFKRSASPGSVTFFPRSFFESNSELFVHPDLEVLFAQDPITEDDKLQVNQQDDSLVAMNIGRQYKNVFKRKYYLQFKLPNGQQQDNHSLTDNLKNWVKKLLTSNSALTSLEFSTPQYLDKSSSPTQTQQNSESQNNNVNLQNKTTIDIEKVFEETKKN